MKPEFVLKHGEYYWALKYNYFGKDVEYFLVQYDNEYGECFYQTGTEVELHVDYFDKVLPEPIQNPFLK